MVSLSSLLTPGRRLSSAEYEELVLEGVLEGKRIELVDGALVEMSPQSERHARVIKRLMRLFSPRLDLVRVQMPLAVGEGWVPEPDVAIAHPNSERDRWPAAALLVVEVSVTTQSHHRRKALAYARAGVPISWLVDLPARTVIVQSSPTREGYASARVRRGSDVLEHRITGVEPITVADLLAG